MNFMVVVGCDRLDLKLGGVFYHGASTQVDLQELKRSMEENLFAGLYEKVCVEPADSDHRFTVTIGDYTFNSCAVKTREEVEKGIDLFRSAMKELQSEFSRSPA